MGELAEAVKDQQQQNPSLVIVDEEPLLQPKTGMAVIMVPKQAIAMCFQSFRDNEFTFIHCPGLPPSTNVVGVNFSVPHGAFMLTLEHPDFDIPEAGKPLPVLELETVMVRAEVVKGDG